MSPDYSQQIPQMAESPYARQRGQRHLVHEIGQNEVITINKDVLAKSDLRLFIGTSDLEVDQNHSATLPSRLFSCFLALGIEKG